MPGAPLLCEVSERWPAVLEEWSQVLGQLAESFRAGRAEVDPRDGVKTCEKVYCELAALCRVRERLPGSGDENAGGVDDDD